jgi:GTPase Era involved in 16S rRNA processing
MADSTQDETQQEVILSLISHTNVGKTALARTLLRRDVGEVADRAHVTVASEAYTLIKDEGLAAKLWDTPGFGSNLAKLAKRIRSSGNPIGWIMHQVWDRFNDESLWCSQEAIRNIKEDADLVLYLVDASQSPGTIGYVDLEMEILSWIGKPVLVFLNQTGRPEPDRIAKEEEEWRVHLSDLDIVKGVSTLDAFTRCWTQEHHILERAAEFLEGDKKAVAEKLAEAWTQRNLNVFDKSVDEISDLLVFSLLDTEKLKESNVVNKLKSLLAKNDKDSEMEIIQQSMYRRLAERTAETINHLIANHGLDGQTAKELAKSSREEFTYQRNVEESLYAAVGGAVSGLVGGLSADLISGGATFGGGAVLGMLLGAGTTYALAKGYNLTQTGTNEVRWTEAQFESQLKFIIMLYLAVSHFGRGRGAWQDPENNPSHWEHTTDDILKANKETLKTLWKKGGAEGKPDKLEKEVRSKVRLLLTSALGKLYPDSAKIF